MRFVSLVKFLAAFLLAPWREAGEINSSNQTLSNQEEDIWLRLSGIDERMYENEENLNDLKTDLTNALNTLISKLSSVSSTLDRVYGRVYGYGSSSIYTKVGSIATAQNAHVIKLNTVSTNMDTIKDTTNAMKTTQLTHVNKLNSVSGIVNQVYGRVYS